MRIRIRIRIRIITCTRIVRLYARRCQDDDELGERERERERERLRITAWVRHDPESTHPCRTTRATRATRGSRWPNPGDTTETLPHRHTIVKRNHLTDHTQVNQSCRSSSSSSWQSSRCSPMCTPRYVVPRLRPPLALRARRHTPYGICEVLARDPCRTSTAGGPQDLPHIYHRTSPCLVASSSPHLIISSSRRLVASSSHHLIISSSRHLIASSSHHLIMSSSHAPFARPYIQRKCGTPKRKAEIRPRGSERWKRDWSGASHAKLAESCAGQCYDTKWCGCYEFERNGKDRGYCKLYKRGQCQIKKKANNKTYAGRCWGKVEPME